jgi:tight adherence protein C
MRTIIIGVAVLTSAVVSVTGAVVLAATVIAAPRVLRARADAKWRRSIAADYPDALELLVLSIEAGYLPAQAVVAIVPLVPRSVADAFVAVGQAMERGRRFADALPALTSHLGGIAEPLVDSLAAADRYGLPLAPVLERLTHEARQQRRRATESAARELPVRLAVPLVLCTLPSYVLLAIVPLLLGALSSLHT